MMNNRVYVRKSKCFTQEDLISIQKHRFNVFLSLEFINFTLILSSLIRFISKHKICLSCIFMKIHYLQLFL